MRGTRYPATYSDTSALGEIAQVLHGVAGLGRRGGLVPALL
jgi:hypothetical protein